MGKRRRVTDEELIEWAERHDLGSLASKHAMTDLRALYDDAISLHLVPRPKERPTLVEYTGPGAEAAKRLAALTRDPPNSNGD